MSDAGAGAVAGAGLGSIAGPIGTGIGAAIGGVGGAVVDWFSNKDANEQNMGMFNRQLAFNHTEAQTARDFAERMADTAHQREVEDLKQAGINPMMTAMGGNGAPSPSGAQATTGAGNAMRPAQVGNYLSGVVPSALSAARTLSDIKNIDKDSLLKDAQTLASTAQAHQASTSAAKTAEELAQLARGRDANAAESDARKNHAVLDQQREAHERLVKEVAQGANAVHSATGAAGDIVDMLNPFKGLGGWKKGYREGIERGTRMGTPLP